ncbi:MAG: hypothetical protein AAGC93_31460 [Cyanobacteria bacterium P01_F01_bin.53]
MKQLNQALNWTAHLERPLEYILAVLCGLLAIAAVIGGGWQYAISFAVLAITLGLPNQAWKTVSLGRILRYTVMTLAVMSLSV